MPYVPLDFVIVAIAYLLFLSLLFVLLASIAVSTIDLKLALAVESVAPLAPKVTV